MTAPPGQGPRKGFRTALQVRIMEENAGLLYRFFRMLSPRMVPGIRGIDIDLMTREFLRAAGAQETLEGYRGFPSPVCVHAADVAAHGVPESHLLAPGDLVTVDLAFRRKDFWVDGAWTWALPGGDGTAQRIRDGAWRTCLAACRSLCATGSLRDMAQSCRDQAAREGLLIHGECGGHGIGRNLHEPPRFGFLGAPEGDGKGPAGGIVAVEPVVGTGGGPLRIREDGALVTRGGEPCAHFEFLIHLSPDGTSGRCLSLPGSGGGLPDCPPF